MLLLIDNYDSFTFNLYQYLGELGAEIEVRRNDELSVEEALAEYRLAVRQGDGEPEVLARVAHAYVALGRVDEAAEYYRQAVSLDEDFRTQAVSDLMGMARRAADTGERFQMASAVQEALAMEPAIGLDDMALPLARPMQTAISRVHVVQRRCSGRAAGASRVIIASRMRPMKLA